ncbi:hypothetical protein BG004_003572 [Podila humilis]|nr:hypothetical protein BG004_003572 [Podila humilis]
MSTIAASTTRTTTVETTDHHFDVISTLDDDLKRSAASVNKIMQKYVDVKTHIFAWDRLITYLNERDGTDITLCEYQTQSIVTHRESCKVFAEKIAKFLRASLKVVLSSSDEDDLVTQLSTTFGNLKGSSTSHFWRTYYDENGKNEGFVYKLLYFVPDGTTKKSFLALVLTLYIKADVHKEGGWFWDITKEDYTVDISGAKFLVFDTISQPQPKEP